MGLPRRTKPDSRSKQQLVLPSESAAQLAMHVCPRCSSTLVQPVNWHEQGDGHWFVQRRCPECEWWGRESFPQRSVDAYDEELDRGGQRLIEDMRALTRANMEEEARRFSSALATDAILPEDF